MSDPEPLALGGDAVEEADEADEADDDARPEVAASEADLIEMARALVAPEAADVWALLAGARPMPGTISPACARLLGEALGQVWPALWRRGAVPGARPWDLPPMALTFGASTLELLRWLVGTPLGAPPSTHLPPRARGALTLGDQIVAYLALAVADGTPAQAAIAAQPLVRAAPLAWLGFADVLGASSSPAVLAAIAAAPMQAAMLIGAPAQAELDLLARGVGAYVVTALAPELARRWRAAELDKRGAVSPVRLVAVGAAQDATLEAWFAACDRSGRIYASFVIDAAAPVLARKLPPEPGQLDSGATLALRQAARVAAGSLLRGVARWAAWDREHRGVRFIDDDYQAAQGLLARFEPIGTAGAELAAHWLAELAALPGA